MARMLINATDIEELRVAIVRDQYLVDLDIERSAGLKKKANIYKAAVTRVEPSLGAGFINYGPTRQGFLPSKEVAIEYHQKSASNLPDGERPSIKEMLKEGQELLVQVEKDERGTKGAALSTYITLAGCYLVLMPNNPRSGGISRRIEGEERDDLRSTMSQLNIPKNMGVIVRTAGVGKSVEDLQWDLDILVNQWAAIQKAAEKSATPALIHQEGDIVIRSIRDNLRKGIDEIIVDSQEVFVKAKNYIEQVKPEYIDKLKLYQDNVPLFTRYKIESQIELAYQRVVVLPSGGSIVIDRTEALVSIDINSAKSTAGVDLEQTALHTNLEAADEIARQLRLRDLGGLVVIDFIDMTPVSHQREVENRLREALRIDRARVQVGRISRFGLLEMSRQRLHLSLGEVTQSFCPHCEGRGVIRSIESLALSMIRLIEQEALHDRTAEVHAQLPVDLATFILNEKRDAIIDIEKRHQVNVLIIANKYMHTPHYKIERVAASASGKDGRRKAPASYTLAEQPEPEVTRSSHHGKAPREKAALQHMVHVPDRVKENESGILKRIWSSLFGGTEEKVEPVQKRQSSRGGQQRRHHHRKRHHGGQQRRSQHGGNKGSGQRRHNQSSGGSEGNRAKGRSSSSRSQSGQQRRHHSSGEATSKTNES